MAPSADLQVSRLRRTARAPASGAASGAGGWTLGALALAALVGLPIAAIAWAAVQGGGSGDRQTHQRGNRQRAERPAASTARSVACSSPRNLPKASHR